MKKKTPDTTIEDLANGIIPASFSSEEDLDAVLKQILDSATSIADAEASSILLVDPTTDTLFFKLATGPKSDEIKAYELKMGQGIAGHVAKTGISRRIADVTREPEWNSQISDNLDYKTRAMICVPMKIRKQTIGVIQLLNKNDGGVFTKSDEEKLNGFSDTAATTIEKSRKVMDLLLKNRELARKEEHLRQENADLKKNLGSKYELIGNSAALKKVISDARKLSRSKTTALIQGQSGTGKELLSHLIHNASPRKNKPLVILNCAALPENLLESELFGHEKGAFTGAANRKIGKFEVAHEGTIFLDEIGEMAAGIQAKLLRVLQEGVFYRIGGNTPITVDVRVLSATNRDLKKEVEAGRFREDLYYRLNVVQLTMPPLKERLDDIPHLVNHFLEIFKKETGTANLKISEAAMRKMANYDWPGNIRELRNAIERAVVMGDGKLILPEDLPISASMSKSTGIRVGISLNDAINEFKKEFVFLNLQYTNGNRSKAAEIMDIQRTYLSRLIKQYNIGDSV